VAGAAQSGVRDLAAIAVIRRLLCVCFCSVSAWLNDYPSSEPVEIEPDVRHRARFVSVRAPSQA